MKLLTEKDLQALQTAMKKRKCTFLAVTLDGVTVTASTWPASSAWDVPMLVRLEMQRGNVYTSQYFESVEALRKAVKESCFT